MGLFTEVVKQKGRGNRSQFWGDYSLLNSIDKKASISPEVLKMIQLGIVKKQMSINNRLKQANLFINNLPTYNSEELENIAANQIFSRIATLLNSPFASGNEIVRNESDKIAQLNQLLKTINVNLPIPETVKSVLSSNTILTKDQTFYDYRREKSQMFEEIAAAYFSGAGLGRAIMTGSWGKLSDSNRQLITDVYAFLNDNNSQIKGHYTPYQKSGFWKADISRATNGIGVSVNSELESFISEMDKLNARSDIGIAIDDELADTLDIVSSLKIQVKSGISQSLLNVNMRNAISLGEFGDSRLNMLMDLFYLDQKQGFAYLYKNAKDSPALTTYSNYLLSINIAKTSMVNSNDIYFTEHGFETAYDWMKNRNVYLKFQKSVKLNSLLLSQRRKYNFNQI